MEALLEVVLLLEHGHWEVLDDLGGVDLSLNHLGDPFASVPETNLLDGVLSDVLELVELGDLLLLQGVDVEVLVINNDFPIEVIDLFLLLLSLLLNHVVA